LGVLAEPCRSHLSDQDIDRLVELRQGHTRTLSAHLRGSPWSVRVLPNHPVSVGQSHGHRRLAVVVGCWERAK
jgi:hypothetical protein